MRFLTLAAVCAAVLVTSSTAHAQLFRGRASSSGGCANGACGVPQQFAPPQFVQPQPFAFPQYPAAAPKTALPALPVAERVSYCGCGERCPCAAVSDRRRVLVTWVP